MCIERRFSGVSDSEVIEICKIVYKKELRSISPNRVDEFLLKIKEEGNSHIVNISGDMNCEFPISIEEINGWFELIENLLEMFSAFYIYYKLEEKNIKEERLEAKWFLDFLRKEQTENKLIKDKKSEKRIEEIYNILISKWEDSNNKE